MGERDDIKGLEQICARIKQKGVITGQEADDLSRLFGDRVAKALEIVASHRVKKYVFYPSNVTRWVVVGREAEYLLLPSAQYCSCDDFHYSFMKGQVHLCVHLIAQKLAEAQGDYKEFPEEDSELDKLIDVP
jgi:predicted nucleic acid-binding Zn finger protein